MIIQAIPGYLFLLTFAIAAIYKLRPSIADAPVRWLMRIGRIRDLRVTIYFL